ncbi:methyl-accepting chemotaxis protein [Alteromonas mediterranea MED64]|mgnify:FL=1|jgi:methyl-accepting chemotaxis protein|uniref:Methyl-accepting chemotaxis protein n=2 Tax=Alteromonadaceae TaxID=72275 RepID=S5AK75_9ALTE|nr:methyl-accepting chemotaxis protein [Alteromonas mediterranea]AGP76983.1 methyl-accepting chemotaxis protein [Alteromonas mediterranea 615]AGP92472.1 methyl-accepting chemotaxis protein [Alteromonas mediterranea U8]MDY6884008.1 methyl-accepting chemotaxis protein [Pseudomonadota bacterium]AGP80657.1 methyl-accepting chemotaxis protein [Alteromonas mediterranea MED64]AGP84479.1 methyl-accepting chemotaxis protein [Alteromonas mediterranea U4]|tara:strand:+ start:791 stop:2410 length:1620 start_codon:yes stop_codon:yes gene_type:complete
MNFLKKMSIASKIFLIPGIAAISFVIYLLITVYTALNNGATLEKVQQVQFPALQQSASTLVDMQKVRDTLSSAVTTGDQDTLIMAQNLAKEVKAGLNQIESISPEFRTEIAKISAGFDDYFKVAFDVSQSMVDGTADFSRLGELSSQMNSSYDDAIAAMSTFRDAQQAAFEEAFENTDRANTSLISTGVILAIVVTILLFATAVPIVRGIKQSIDDVVRSLKDIAQENGDLTVRIETKSEDEIGELVYWFNQFMDKLQGVVRDVVEASLPLSNLAQNLRGVTEETQRTINVQQQSATNAKSAVDTMSGSVDGVAHSAAQAASDANEATSAASEGRQIVQQTVTSIQQLAENVRETADVIARLESDSNKVGSVLDVIKGIAEQTNLLALNAAIEAARAGEQGRGFAVVADEVRTLASRTQQSTEEIQSTIEQLQSAAHSAVEVMARGTEQASSSVETANKAGSSLETITSTIGRINQMNEQIAHNTEDQRTVAVDIVRHVDEIHQRTEQTSSRSVELGTMCNELADLAQHLESIAKQFRV